MSLVQDVSSIQLTHGSDQVYCSIAPDGIYRVSALKQLIDHKHVCTHPPILINWCKLIPIKVLCFVWRAVQGRIPCAAALISRNIPIDFVFCGLCINQQEDADHILISCPYASMVRSEILRWCGVDDMAVQTVSEFIDLTSNWG